MTRIITIISQKGEQAKSTTAVNFAAAFAKTGRVGHVVDLDSQQLDAYKFAGSIPNVSFHQQWPTQVSPDEFVIADTSPIINPTTIRALQQSEVALIPITPLSLSLEALARTFETIAAVRSSYPELRALVVFTKTDSKPFTAGVVAATRVLSEWPVAKSIIPARLMDFERSVMARTPVVIRAPKSSAALAYCALAKEV